MEKIIAFVMVGLLLVMPGVLAHAGDDYYDHHGMMSGFYGGYGGMWGMGLFGWIIGLLVIVALVLFIVWLIRQLQYPSHSKASGRSHQRKRK